MSHLITTKAANLKYDRITLPNNIIQPWYVEDCRNWVENGFPVIIAIVWLSLDKLNECWRNFLNSEFHFKKSTELLNAIDLTFFHFILFFTSNECFLSSSLSWVFSEQNLVPIAIYNKTL